MDAGRPVRISDAQDTETPRADAMAASVALLSFGWALTRTISPPRSSSVEVSAPEVDAEVFPLASTQQNATEYVLS